MIRLEHSAGTFSNSLKVIAGEKRGTYKLKYISYKTFSAQNPDKMTLLIENIAYTGY
jgi:hypothetical protein